jgi:tetratricopeptide (TPR) repeat protein
MTSASVDPHRAYTAATSAAADADPPTRIAGLRSLALACKELGRLDEGLSHLDEALRIAESAGLEYAAAQVRMNLVGLLTARGELEAALAAADEAGPVLSGADADRLLANRACALARSGRITEVSRIARTCTDPEVLVGLRINTGLAKMYAGRLGRAEADLRAALSVAARSGLHHQATIVRHNLAVVALRRGDLPRALALFDDLEPELAGTGERLCQLHLDRTEALLAARLPTEARELVTSTLERLGRSGYHCDTADALLLLAHAELSDGDPAAAAATARRAREAFGDRTGYALLAERIHLQARWTAGDRSASLGTDAARTAGHLEMAGWSAAAADTRILAALVSLAQGDRTRAEHLLARIGGGIRAGTVGTRVAAWHAVALLREVGGDRTGAASAVRAGLRVVDEHAAALGAVELRGRAAGWGAELAEIGVRLARGPRALLLAAERARAIADRPPSVRPPADRRLAGLLAELRRVGAAVPANPALIAAQTRLEDAVRAHTRRLATRRDGVRAWGRLLPDLVAALGDRVLVELIRDGDALLAVTVMDGRFRRHSLGSYAQACHDVRLLRFAVSRLAREAAGDRSGPAAPHLTSDPNGPAAIGLACAARRLDRRLIEPLRIRDRPLVIVPTGGLHGLPWSALPTLTALTVVPSAASWLRAVRRPATPGHVTLVAGPGLAHAEAEVAAVAPHHRDALVLTGDAATADAVHVALDGSGLAHLAAHGTFRSGNALFSSIRLADGPLVAYDLERLRRPPRLMVLSACDAGRADVRAGEAVMGMVTVALEFGTASVVAGLTPVGDAAARDLMTAFHRNLAAGSPPAEALAAAPREPAALGLTCFGAGW